MSQRRVGRPVSPKTKAVLEHLMQHDASVKAIAHATRISYSDADHAVRQLRGWQQVYQVSSVPTGRRPAGVFAAVRAPALQPADLSAALLSGVMQRWSKGTGGA